MIFCGGGARVRMADSGNEPANQEAAREVADSFNYTGDRPFHGRIQVTALGLPQSRYMILKFHCSTAKEDCPDCPLLTELTSSFTAPNVDPSAFATYFDTNYPRDVLRVLVERGLPVGCPAWWKGCQARGEDERAVTQAIVLDLQGTEGRAWFVHGPKCDLKRAPNWIIAEGWLCRGKMGRIGVLVTSFKPESEVATPRPEDVVKARATLRAQVDESDGSLENSVVWKAAMALWRRSQLKGNEVVKGFVSDLMTIASPVWVKTCEGPPQLGITSSELGPTTTAKSQRAREVIDWLGCGKYETGRKTIAGLTAGAEKVESIGWVVKKGLLPSMDLSFLVIDNMPPYALNDQIESRRNGIVVLTAIRSLELWARCRLKLLGNPQQPFDEMIYKCEALKMYDPKLIARYAFGVFTYGVTINERYSKEIVQPQPGDDELLDAARTILRWNLSKEITFTVPESLWAKIMELGKILEKTYGCEDIPLLLRANPYKLSVVAYSFALLEGFTEPTERHIEQAYKWLDFCAKDIELDKYVELWRGQHELSELEYATIKLKIDEVMEAEVKEHGGGLSESYTYKMIEYPARNEVGQRDEIAAYVGIEPPTVSEKMRLLKGLELLRSDKSGYRFTAKGVKFVKRWSRERAVTDLTNLTTLEGQTQPHGNTQIESVAPINGNISNMGNRNTEPTEGTPDELDEIWRQFAESPNHRETDTTTGQDLPTPEGSRNTAKTTPTTLRETGTQEIIGRLRKYNDVTDEEEWKKLMVELGMSEGEANALFQKLTAGGYLVQVRWFGMIYWKWGDQRGQ